MLQWQNLINQTNQQISTHFKPEFQVIYDINRSISLLLHYNENHQKQSKEHLLIDRGGGEGSGIERGSGRGGEEDSLAALFEEVVFALVFADLDKVVLPAPPRLLHVHPRLVPLLPHLHPRSRPQRHLRRDRRRRDLAHFLTVALFFLE